PPRYLVNQASASGVVDTAAQVSPNNVIATGSPPPLAATCSGSISGAMSVTPPLSVGFTKASAGCSRWVTKLPSASTTIQLRSNANPVGTMETSFMRTPAQDLTG